MTEDQDHYGVAETIEAMRSKSYREIRRLLEMVSTDFPGALKQWSEGMKNISGVVLVYVDGACTRKKEKVGGWGVVAYADGKVLTRYGSARRTTNNKMEITAALEALKMFDAGRKLIIYSDSKYVVNGITEWIYFWRKNGWKTSMNTDVKNRTLWEALYKAASKRNVDWRWVRGHSGIIGNELADALAIRGRREARMQSRGEGVK